MPMNAKKSKAQVVLPTEGNSAECAAATSVERLFGILHRPGMRPVSIKEMNEGIGQFHAAEDARIRKGRE
jgi:hypothetical protein